MDYIKQFEIELDKDVYYAGETLSGCVLVQNTDNVKVQGIFKCHILSVFIFFSVSKVLPRFPAV